MVGASDIAALNSGSSFRTKGLLVGAASVIFFIVLPVLLPSIAIYVSLVFSLQIDDR